MNDQLLYQLKSQVENFRLDQEGSNKRLNEFKRLIDECVALTSKIESHSDFIKYQDRWNSSSDRANQTATDRLDKQHQDIEEIKKKLEQHSGSLAATSKYVTSLTIEQDNIKSNASTKDPTYRLDSIEKDIANLRKEIAKGIETVRSECTLSPSDLAASNQTVIQKVEAALLDGSNAVLKVNNTEMQIKILERKIENLSIQLKKLELTKQLS